MIIHGSMRHAPSGRRKKKLPTVRRKKQAFTPYVPSSVYRRETPEYKSVSIDPKIAAGVENSSYKKEISSKYTLAPAYNKGAYQVISKENIKDIGR